LECHPDRNPGDSAAEERFKEVSVAYSVLSDPAKRRDYDLSQTFGGGGGSVGFPNFGGDGGTQQNIEEMVEMFTDFLENSPLFEQARQDAEREAARKGTRKKAKKAKKKAPKRAPKKKAKAAAPKCSACGDTKSQTVRQGGASFKIRCQAC
jgi:DnaJ-class molecular chaperone